MSSVYKVVSHICLIALFTVSYGCASSSSSSKKTTLIPQDAQDHSLGQGDVFDVRVYGEEELSASYRISQSGTIDFPLVGRLEVEGLDPSQISDLIAQKLKEGQFIHDPQVSIFVKETNSKRISVVGAVQKPGSFPMTPGLTVVQSVGLAGGFTPLASQDSTVVSRRVGDKLKRYRVEVSEITEGKKDDFFLRAGDIIFVPERIF